MYTPEEVISQSIFVRHLMEYDGPVLSHYIFDHKLVIVQWVDMPRLSTFHEVLEYIQQCGIPNNEDIRTALQDDSAHVFLYSVLSAETALKWESDMCDLRTSLLHADQHFLHIAATTPASCCIGTPYEAQLPSPGLCIPASLNNSLPTMFRITRTSFYMFLITGLLYEVGTRVEILVPAGFVTQCLGMLYTYFAIIALLALFTPRYWKTRFRWVSLASAYTLIIGLLKLPLATDALHCSIALLFAGGMVLTLPRKRTPIPVTV